MTRTSVSKEKFTVRERVSSPMRERLYIPAKFASVSNAAPQQAVFSVPFWHRHGTQPEYWSEVWRRKELLADLDILSGNVVVTDDMEELISLLESAADARPAD